jgi:hypothetical protein
MNFPLSSSGSSKLFLLIFLVQAPCILSELVDRTDLSGMLVALAIVLCNADTVRSLFQSLL